MGYMTEPRWGRRPEAGLRRFVIALLVVCAASTASAKTIVITDGDCEFMGVLSADAPRMSWAAVANATAEYGNHYIDLTPKTSFVIRYPLDKIPPGQRITKAEWVVPYAQVSPATGVKVQVRRLLKDWGPGVSHQYRMIRPQRLEWHTPGAQGVGQDRAAKATAADSIQGAGEHTFNVTEDVELWYSGAAPNYGWQLATDEAQAWFRTHSPFWQSPKGWKLRITYEPQ
jgi:hypothetical protein